MISPRVASSLKQFFSPQLPAYETTSPTGRFAVLSNQRTDGSKSTGQSAVWRADPIVNYFALSFVLTSVIRVGDNSEAINGFSRQFPCVKGKSGLFDQSRSTKITNLQL